MMRFLVNALSLRIEIRSGGSFLTLLKKPVWNFILPTNIKSLIERSDLVPECIRSALGAKNVVVFFSIPTIGLL